MKEKIEAIKVEKGQRILCSTIFDICAKSGTKLTPPQKQALEKAGKLEPSKGNPKMKFYTVTKTAALKWAKSLEEKEAPDKE